LGVLGRGPLRGVLETTVHGFDRLADIGEQKTSLIHVLLCWALVLEGDLLQCTFQLLIQRTKRKAEGLISIATTLEKDLEHVQSECMIVMPSHR
jgi:hypothetical protein